MTYCLFIWQQCYWTIVLCVYETKLCVCVCASVWQVQLWECDWGSAQCVSDWGSCSSVLWPDGHSPQRCSILWDLRHVLQPDQGLAAWRWAYNWRSFSNTFITIEGHEKPLTVFPFTIVKLSPFELNSYCLSSLKKSAHLLRPPWLTSAVGSWRVYWPPWSPSLPMWLRHTSKWSHSWGLQRLSDTSTW